MIRVGAVLPYSQLQNQPRKYEQSRKKVYIFESMILALKVYFPISFTDKKRMI